MERQYIDNDKTKGTLYDYDLVRKEYKKLKCPKGFFNVSNLPLEEAKWFLCMSVRANTGKTTNALLWLLCEHEIYGTIGAYVRQRDEQITPKFTKDMFGVIVEYGYIEKITKGKYNNITYKSRRWYLTKVDENGEIVEQEKTPVLIMLCVQKHLDYKSTLNEPMLDTVIFDEFLSSDLTLIDEFISLCDLLSTIFRMRESGKIFMLANNIDRFSSYFHELDIYDEVQKLNFGDSKIITSPLGTRVYVAMLKVGETQQKMKDSQTKLFFGFNNPKLSAITGQFTWAVKNYQHIPKDINYNNEITIDRYVRYNGNLIRMRLINDDKIGMMLLFQYATKCYDNAIIYTRDEITDRNERRNLGYSKVDRFLWTLYEKGRAYFSTNDVGSIIDNYLKECAEYKRLVN